MGGKVSFGCTQDVTVLVLLGAGILSLVLGLAVEVRTMQHSACF